MQWSDIDFDPGYRKLRQFAGLLLIIAGSFVCVQGLILGQGTWSLLVAGCAAILGMAGLLYPRVVREVFVLWMVVAFPLGWLVSTVILVAVFYAVFLPMGLVFRIAGRDALNRFPKRQNVVTYWHPKAVVTHPNSFFRQF
jgi:hypothetical protein